MAESDAIAAALNSPSYTISETGGASYRKLTFTNPLQKSFDVFSWKKEGKAKQKDFLDFDANEDEPGFFLPSAKEETTVIKPGCFWEETEDEDGNEELDGAGAQTLDQLNESQIDLIKYENNLWVGSISVPVSLVGLIIGKGRTNLTLLENSTRTKIVIPPRSLDVQGKFTTITITNKDSDDYVRQAVVQIKQLVDSKLQKASATVDNQLLNQRPRYTHFISLPIVSESVGNQVAEFHQKVMEKNYQGIDATLFQPINRLHFTLCMLSLDSEEDVARCVAVLDTLSRRIYDVLNTRTLLVDLMGVHVMNDDDSDARVIFTKPGRGKLSTSASQSSYKIVNLMCSVLFSSFIENKLISKEELQSQRCLATDGITPDIKLHATLINKKFRNSKMKANNRNLRVDATQLASNFQFWDFGQVALKQLHLSQLDQFDKETGYYRCIRQIRLP